MFNRKHITNRCRGCSQAYAPELNRWAANSIISMMIFEEESHDRSPTC